MGINVESIPKSGVLRKMLDASEIKQAEKLVKEGVLIKGRSDDKQKSIVYYRSKRWQELLCE